MGGLMLNVPLSQMQTVPQAARSFQWNWNTNHSLQLLSERNSRFGGMMTNHTSLALVSNMTANNVASRAYGGASLPALAARPPADSHVPASQPLPTQQTLKPAIELTDADVKGMTAAILRKYLVEFNLPRPSDKESRQKVLLNYVQKVRPTRKKRKKR
jgi:hypothetical protein